MTVISDAEMYFYRPRAGHGLPHDPFNAIVAPRPIGWIATRGEGGVNLAPYSFFNAFCYHPPILGFSSQGEKHSLRNARETGEFVWNLVTFALAERMNATAANLAYGEDELRAAGLSPLPCHAVAVPRVGESPVAFECKVTEIHRLRDQHGQPAENTLVLGEVVGVHIAHHLLRDGIFDTEGADIIVRAGGPSAYVRITPQAFFDMRRPA